MNVIFVVVHVHLKKKTSQLPENKDLHERNLLTHSSTSTSLRSLIIHIAGSTVYRLIYGKDSYWLNFNNFDLFFFSEHINIMNRLFLHRTPLIKYLTSMNYRGNSKFSENDLNDF